MSLKERNITLKEAAAIVAAIAVIAVPITGFSNVKYATEATAAAQVEIDSKLNKYIERQNDLTVDVRVMKSLIESIAKRQGVDVEAVKRKAELSLIHEDDE